MLAPRLRLKDMFSKLMLKQTCNMGEYKKQTTTPSYHDGCVADVNVSNLASRLSRIQRKDGVFGFLFTPRCNRKGITWLKLLDSKTNVR